MNHSRPHHLTKIHDSGVGTFTATYDAGGKPVSVNYPDGLRAEYAYDATGATTSLRYAKTTHCTEHCTWYTDEIVPSIHGQRGCGSAGVTYGP